MPNELYCPPSYIDPEVSYPIQTSTCIEKRIEEMTEYQIGEARDKNRLEIVKEKTDDYNVYSIQSRNHREEISRVKLRGDIHRENILLRMNYSNVKKGKISIQPRRKITRNQTEIGNSEYHDSIPKFSLKADTNMSLNQNERNSPRDSERVFEQQNQNDKYSQPQGEVGSDNKEIDFASLIEQAMKINGVSNWQRTESARRRNRMVEENTVKENDEGLAEGRLRKKNRMNTVGGVETVDSDNDSRSMNTKIRLVAPVKKKSFGFYNRVENTSDSPHLKRLEDSDSSFSSDAVNENMHKYRLNGKFDTNKKKLSNFGLNRLDGLKRPGESMENTESKPQPLLKIDQRPSASKPIRLSAHPQMKDRLRLEINRRTPAKEPPVLKHTSASTNSSKQIKISYNLSMHRGTS